MKYLHYAIVLGFICALAAFGVAGTFILTRKPIEEMSRAEAQRAQKAAIHTSSAADEKLAFTVLNLGAAEETQVSVAKDASGKVIGYVAHGQAQGYGGKVRVMVGMDAAGEKVLGVTVLPHNETPGLGTQINEEKSTRTWVMLLTGRKAEDQDTTPVFLRQFPGKRLEDMKLKTGSGEGIQGITGATISSRAAVEAARDAVEKIRAAVRDKQ